ncbi:MAG: MFS transporter [Candidatus Micrarchaeota archaeon]
MVEEPKPQQAKQPSLEEQLEKSKEYSVKDGIYYSIMTGFGVQFITPFALRLGATVADIGFLQTFPQLFGSLGQLFYSKLARTYQSRRELVLKLVSLQTAMWLGFIFLSLFSHNNAVSLLVLFYSLFALAELLANPAWTSWMGDIVKEKERASFFGRRNELTSFAAFVTTMIAGWTLGFFDNLLGGLYGFTVIFAVAFAARIISLWYLSRKVEPRLEQAPPAGGFASFLKQITKSNFGSLVLYNTIMVFAVNVSSPYLAVYMLRDLGFDYASFGLVTAGMQVSLFLTMVYWGDAVSRLGNKTVLYASGLVVSILPLGWSVFTTPLLLFLAEFTSGLGWAGQRIATLNLVLKTTPAEEKARFVAYYNFFQGIAVFAGAMVGAWLSIVLQNQSFLFFAGLPLVFVISAVLRFASVLLFIPRIQDEESKGSESKAYLLKTVTIYPMRSAVHEIELGVRKGLGKAAELEKEFDEVKKKADEAFNKLKIKRI